MRTRPQTHTDFHMCTLYTHSSAYTGCLTPRLRFQYPYSVFYASTWFLQFDLLIPWALQIFSPPLFPQLDRWYGRCFIGIGLWNSYIKKINLYKLPTTLGKTQQNTDGDFFNSFSNKISPQAILHLDVQKISFSLKDVKLLRKKIHSNSVIVVCYYNIY